MYNRQHPCVTIKYVSIEHTLHRLGCEKPLSVFSGYGFSDTLRLNIIK